MSIKLGQKFGNWKVLSPIPGRIKGALAILVTDGFETKYVLKANLTSGRSTQSRKQGVFDRKDKYSRFNSELYSRWEGIKQRCYNPNDVAYQYYGGRGITVSEEFKGSQAFCTYVDSLPRGEGQNEIDRIDNNGNYERGNLRWATHKENINNRRNTKSSCLNNSQ